MNAYAQNKEDLLIIEYFGDFKGTLLDIGANDGLTFSNSRLLIELGWKAHLVEPSSVYDILNNLYRTHTSVSIYPLAIGEETCTMVLHESGSHVPNGVDKALVSSLDEAETLRWRKNGVHFKPVGVPVFKFIDFWEMTGFAQFDFISIDAEGFDWLILRQIDLNAVGCKCLIIEHNGDEGLKTDYCEYCEKFGLTPATANRENIIFVKCGNQKN